MAFHGDLSSYPFPDLLQWLEGARKSGALTLSSEAGQRRLFFLDGHVIACAAPGLWERLARVLEASGDARGEALLTMLEGGRRPAAEVERALSEVAREELFGGLVDLLGDARGAFHWTEDADRGGDEWVTLDLSARHVLFEVLRRADEAEEVRRVFPNERLMVRAAAAQSEPGHALGRAVLALLRRESQLPLSRLWLALGLSRGVVVRAVYELRRAGRLTVDGAPADVSNPVAEMLEKGAVLLGERQFDAATLLFSALMERDPGDRRVRQFARMVEREHVANLYRELPPVATFDVSDAPAVFASVRAEERPLVEQLRLGWDVSAVVLASPRREVETLLSLRRLVRQGVLALRDA